MPSTAVFQRVDGLAGDIHDHVLVPQAGMRRDRVRHYLADDGPRRRHAGAEQHPVDRDGEHEIEHRAGEQYGDALPDRLAIEGAVHFMRRDVALALVQQLDVATQRNRRNHVFDRVLACDALPQRFAEPDGETQHADAETARHPEMPEFVDRDQDADGDRKSHDRDQDLQRTVR
jgi:hypothetical protein